MKTSKVGCRIVVFGPTGSGKSTLAQALAERLGVPFIELDGIFWMPHWTQKPREQFRADVQVALDQCPDGWVVAGNYTSHLGGTVLSRADTVVWLRLPFPVTLWRLLVRTLHRSWRREVLWGTNMESWRRSFFSRDSILLWAVTSRKSHVEHVQRLLRDVPYHADVFELRSRREVQELLESIRVAKV